MGHKMSPALVHVFKQAGRDELKKAMEDKDAVHKEQLRLLEEGGTADPLHIGIVQGLLMGFEMVREIIEELDVKKAA